MAVAILRFFAGPDILFGVRCAWFCSLSIIILVPADIWTFCENGCTLCTTFSYSFLNLIHLEGNAKTICAKLKKVLVRNRRNICTTIQISYKKASQKIFGIQSKGM
ncbi:uncharacterized protein LOC108511099 isoform X2 [Phoenix dactylifera]|uniref:Uncharacterized protein LOC108511099 isoform X2 n=1 Tax=Phoenix dactylifera TaxID=42345 RepID=A0A8B9AJQ7_PHODC|nr:uncharacterized protein LOC108511099 isoform X2 [Phoenix dactylifera]